MNEYYENIKNKTVCPECESKELGFGYMYESNGIVKRRTEVLGVPAYQGAANVLMIVCNKCNCIVKSFIVAR